MKALLGQILLIKVMMVNKLSMKNKVINVINTFEDINIEVLDEENVLVNVFLDKPGSINMNTLSHNNSKLTVLFSAINNGDLNVNFNSSIDGSNNEVIIKYRNVSKSGVASAYANVRALSNTNNNVILEDLKAILEGGDASVFPVLEVDTNDVDAQHFATVGSFSKDKMFYLMSKGLSKDSAYDLLKNSFLYSIFDDDFKKCLK